VTKIAAWAVLRQAAEVVVLAVEAQLLAMLALRGINNPIRRRRAHLASRSLFKSISMGCNSGSFRCPEFPSGDTRSCGLVLPEPFISWKPRVLADEARVVPVLARCFIAIV
jgi:hypothetical protein